MTGSDPRISTPPQGVPRPRPLADRVLRLLWRERRISRAEISRRLDISRSTVSEIVGTLLPTGLVAEIGSGPSQGGRRPIVLEFQDEACCTLGVEMGAAHVAAALTDLHGHVLAWEHQAHPVRSDPEGTRKLVAALARACIEGGSYADRLVGIGVAVPSPVDPSRPDHLSEVVLPEWGGRLGLRDLLAGHGTPVFVDNDANLGALAERWWGVGVGVEDFTYVKIGTGIGAGHVIGGKIYRGGTGIAGEVGHLVVDPHGDPCICGLRGCLATFVGAAALVARARALLDDYPGSRLADTDITIEAIEEAALRDDALALQLTREAAEHLSVAVAGMLNLMNPSLVILGGGLARLGDILLDPLRDAVHQRTLLSSVAAATIRTSDLGPRSVAIGAATLVLETALDDPRLFPVVAARAATT